MTVEQKIDYMILSLQIAKEEVEKYRDFVESKPENKTLWEYKYNSKEKCPNGTMIRENLKGVGRTAFNLANEITLSVYDEKLTREE